MKVNVVCQNWEADRVIPRFARMLRDRLGWSLSKLPDPAADVVYLFAYFEATRFEWPRVPVAAYFTHREEEPPGNQKSRLFDSVAAKCQLRTCMCELYASQLREHGSTMIVPSPVEIDKFVIKPRRAHKRPVVGFSGYTYMNHRKGEDLVRGIVDSPLAKKMELRASGRGWPVPTRGYAWAQMKEFYQGLDVLVCPSRVEGGPMPPLEALACGVSVVIPRGVGLLDEIPDARGICRYERGDLKSLLVALEEAAFPTDPPDREALRAATAGHSVEAWVEGHRTAFEQAFSELERSCQASQAGCPGNSEVERSCPASQGSCPAVETAGNIRRNLPAQVRGEGSKTAMSGKRGIYCVAFGEPSRECAKRMMASAKRHMPDVPICLVAASPIGLEDVLIEQPDSDVGGRRAKLKAYQLAPAEWETVLYLDADTELVEPAYELFDIVAESTGCDLAIRRDIQTIESIARRSLGDERAAILAVADENSVMYNGGVWVFRRSARTEQFFARWIAEWDRFGRRDQGALLRALAVVTLKIRELGPEWNHFPRFEAKLEGAKILHWPGDARRWDGVIVGRLDSQEAWGKSATFMRKRNGQSAIQTAAAQSPMVHLEVAPGRYVCCRPGEEERYRKLYAQRGRRNTGNADK